MKRIDLIAIAGLALGAWSACSGQSAEEPTEPTVVDPRPPSASEGREEQAPAAPPATPDPPLPADADAGAEAGPDPKCDPGKVRCGGACCARVSVGAGDAFTCALSATSGVKCWGSNASGQLGDGTTATRTAPVGVVGLDKGVVAVAAGAAHACALTDAGAVKCWGANQAGQLGDGTTVTRFTPVDVPSLASGVVAIAAGTSTTCAITDAGALRCWGQILGEPNGTFAFLPVEHVSSAVARVDVGSTHACFLTTSGEARCFGGNSNSQLGNGTSATSATPVVPISQGATVVSASPARSAAVANGVVKWWGSGVGSTPRDLGNPGTPGIAVTLSGNNNISVLQLGGNVLSSWGDGLRAVQGVTDAVEIAMGSQRACARTSSGAVACWNANTYAASGVAGL